MYDLLERQRKKDKMNGDDDPVYPPCFTQLNLDGHATNQSFFQPVQGLNLTSGMQPNAVGQHHLSDSRSGPDATRFAVNSSSQFRQQDSGTVTAPVQWFYSLVVNLESVDQQKTVHEALGEKSSSSKISASLQGVKKGVENINSKDVNKDMVILIHH